jgi:hypothetical protein
VFDPSFQANDGEVPPFIGVALKVSNSPAQVGFDPVIMLIATEAVLAEPTTIVIEFDVASVGLAQGELDVITQVTICPLVKFAVV